MPASLKSARLLDQAQQGTMPRLMQAWAVTAARAAEKRHGNAHAPSAQQDRYAPVRAAVQRDPWAQDTSTSSLKRRLPSGRSDHGRGLEAARTSHTKPGKVHRMGHSNTPNGVIVVNAAQTAAHGGFLAPEQVASAQPMKHVQLPSMTPHNRPASLQRRRRGPLARQNAEKLASAEASSAAQRALEAKVDEAASRAQMVAATKARHAEAQMALNGQRRSARRLQAALAFESHTAKARAAAFKRFQRSEAADTLAVRREAEREIKQAVKVKQAAAHQLQQREQRQARMDAEAMGRAAAAERVAAAAAVEQKRAERRAMAVENKALLRAKAAAQQQERLDEQHQKDMAVTIAARAAARREEEVKRTRAFKERQVALEAFITRDWKAEAAAAHAAEVKAMKQRALDEAAEERSSKRTAKVAAAAVQAENQRRAKAALRLEAQEARTAVEQGCVFHAAAARDAATAKLKSRQAKKRGQQQLKQELEAMQRLHYHAKAVAETNATVQATAMHAHRNPHERITSGLSMSMGAANTGGQPSQVHHRHVRLW